MRAAYPKNSEEMSLVTWDVSNLKGQQVYFEAIDGIEAAENGWMGFGEMFTYNYKDAPEDDYWSFESGTYDGWERTGDAFPAQANSSKLGRPMGDDNGTFWADTNVNGEDKTGTLTQNKMTTKQVYADFNLFDGEKLDFANQAHRWLLKTAVLANDSTSADGKEIGDPTEVALINLAHNFWVEETTYRAQHLVLQKLHLTRIVS